MSGLYLLLLTGSIAGLAQIDHRHKLAYFSHRRRTVLTLLITVLVFVAWDVAGIVAGIFFIGDAKVLSGIRIGQFPLEELFFLGLLSYVSLLTYATTKRWRVMK